MQAATKDRNDSNVTERSVSAQVGRTPVTAAADKDAEATRGRRVTVDLTPAATEEVDRLKEVTGLTTADIFRHSLSLFRIYVEARQQADELRIVNPASTSVQTRIELPFSVAARS